MVLKEKAKRKREKPHKKAKRVREKTSKHVYKQASKEKECPQGKNVCLDIVSIDPLHWIMDDLRANKHGSKKGTRDPVYKDKHEPA